MRLLLRRSAGFLLLLPFAPAGVLGQAQTLESTAPASDTAEYRPLHPNRAQHDCDALPAPDVCRVLRRWTGREVRALLERGPVHYEDGLITFVHEAEADSVDLSGGLQYPMARVRGTDLWVITLNVPDVERALITWFMIPYIGGDLAALSFKPNEWRGPAASAPVLRATELQGRLVNDTLASPLIRRPRGVSVYIPPARGVEPIAAVVYLGDNGAAGLAAVVDTLISTGRLPRIMLVGIEADRRRADEAPDATDHRALEYLYVPARDSARFLSHEQFLLTVVLPWAERGFGAPADAGRRAIGGFSNSAAFALDMAMRRPDLFTTAIALSPAGRAAAMLPGVPTDRLGRFYLAGGTLEKGFHAKAVAWAAIFAELGVEHVLKEPVAGHDWSMWASHFADALLWAYADPQDVGRTP